MHKNHKEEFLFLNYHTEFSVEGDNKIPFGKRACFDDVVRKHRNYEKYEKVLKKGELVSNKYTVRVIFSNPEQEENNCCLLSVDELFEWINDMKRFAEFEFCFRPDDSLPDGEAVFVDLEFKKRPFAEHFLVLEMIKHSYEFSFNFSVYQAVKLRNIINPDELLINLHNMIFCCNEEFRTAACSDHTITTYVQYLFDDFNTNGPRSVVMMRTADELKEMLPLTTTLSSMFNPAVTSLDYLNANNFSINFCDDQICRNDPRIRTCIEQFKKFEYFFNERDSCDIRTFKSYFNPKLCKKRLDVYLNTYERIRRDGRQTN